MGSRNHTAKDKEEWLENEPEEEKSFEPTSLACRRKTYYKKRRYRCPGKRRYKAHTKHRCCSKAYKWSKRINLCNRNWARISIHPFINFLRVFRRRYRKDTPIGKIAGKGRCAWRRMSACGKKPYYEQAKRARIRGFRT